MVVRNKLYRIIDKYRVILQSRYEKTGYKSIRNGNETKNKILDFYLKNHRWPSRRSSSKLEKALGTRFENFISKKSRSYDAAFRRLARATGRNTNNKRSHDVKGYKKAILEFIKNNGRVPTTYSGEMIEGEAKLRGKLDYYTLRSNDMTFLGQVYDRDKCHRSGIPVKYRAIINETLNVKKPLIRMV